MMIRKLLLVTGVMALASTPAWALPTQAPSNGGTAHAPETTPVGPPSSTPNNESNPGAANRSAAGTEGSSHTEGAGEPRGSAPSGKGEGKPSDEGEGKGKSEGKSRRCAPHKVAYTLAGVLLSGSLAVEEGSTNLYKGEIELEVKRANHHAHAAKGTTQTFSLEGVRLNGPVASAEIADGDWVRLIGNVTFLPRKCEATEFTPTVTIKRVVVHRSSSHHS